jgi:hypothetical protein
VHWEGMSCESIAVIYSGMSSRMSMADVTGDKSRFDDVMYL